MILTLCKIAYKHLLKHNSDLAYELARDVRDDPDMPYDMVASKHIKLSWLGALDYIEVLLAVCYIHETGLVPS